ncbi:MAG: methyltransferase [Caulobacteraceae bacterium]
MILRQPRVGYRAGLDAALLAAACDADGETRVLEAGCGAGAALLAVAARQPRVRVIGVERNVETLELARENIVANGMEDRAGVFEGDVAAPFTELGQPPFDRVIANPPFFDDPNALRAPHPAKRDAWIAEGGLTPWIDYMAEATKANGALILIHRADRLGDILRLVAPRCGSVQIRAVQPFAEAPAKRVLVRAVKGGRAPLVLLPALILHPRDGAKHTAEAEAILRGEADLDWR